MSSYLFGEIELNNKEQILVQRIIIHILKKKVSFPIIKFGIKNRRDLYPNYFHSDPQLQPIVNELGTALGNKLGMKNFKVSSYADLHSFFPVGWHTDAGIHKETEQSSIDFFKNESMLLKLYIKLPFSPLDICIKDKAENIKFLKSNKEKLGFFDVRILHRTYLRHSPLDKIPFVLKLKEIIHKILIRLTNSYSFFPFHNFSNFYFLIFEKTTEFNKYEKEEIKRSLTQII